MAKKLNASIILNKESSLNLMELVGFIKGASYIISNDTGPAHISAHLNKKGLVLFGSHKSPKKVSLGSENFKSIQAKQLKDLEVSTVLEKIKADLN